VLTSGEESPSRYSVTITAGRDDSDRRDPVIYHAAASRPASIVSAHTVGKIISIDTPYPPGRYAAVVVAPCRRLRCAELKHQALSPSQPACDARTGEAQKHCLPKPVVTGIAGDLNLAHSAVDPPLSGVAACLYG
jgi:hypothetical protein